MNRQLQAVIFDLDGVIADTNDYYNRANRKLAELWGTTVSDEENEAFKGIHRSAIVKAIAAKAGKTLTEEETARYGTMKNAFYQQQIAELSPQDILPGVELFLQELRQAGILIALASSSSNYRFVLERLGVAAHFHVAVDPAYIRRMKPAPDIFERAAELLGVAAENCAAIEDGEAGLAAIRATPMFAVAIGNAPFQAAADWQLPDTRGLRLAELRRRFEDKQCGGV